MIIPRFLLCLSLLLLWGCSGNPIGKVKNSPVKLKEETTIGRLFDGYSHFTMTSWGQEEGGSNGTLVSASGIVATEFWDSPLEQDNPWDIPKVNTARLELRYLVDDKGTVSPESIVVTYIASEEGVIDEVCARQKGELVSGGCKVVRKGGNLADRLRKIYTALEKERPLPL
ncbi:hypothetical protein LJC46_06055 [Desulfovibrio sp. OttesenSCG-928-G15]|nr:hypothetical protein [Desulfovibrio sp. OttesenSCG-928-G15]